MPKRHSPTRSICAAKTRQGGEPCQRQAGWGTGHLGWGMCKMHGGLLPAHVKHAAKLAAADLPMVMGFPEETDPNEAVMRALYAINGAVSYCDHMVAVHSTAGELELGTPSDDMRYWLGVRAAVITELSRVAKMASDMGVSQRQVELAERMGDLLADLIGGVLGELALTQEQQERAPLIVRRHLELVAGRAAV